MISKELMDEIKDYPSQEYKVWVAAQEYINNGIFVVPLAPGTKKLPERKTSINYGSASRNIKVIESWFHPTEGRFAGWNIGIACGREGGVFAVDVDRHTDGTDGFEELSILTKENGELPDGPVQMTPNGGKHYIYRWQEGGMSSTGKIAPSIDTRGGSADQCKGHIVAFPSVVNGKLYEWECDGDIPEIPPWIIHRMGAPWKPRKDKGGRGNENVSEGDEEVKLPVTQLEDMLGFIDPDDMSYDEWLRIGMAVKSQLPDDEGFKLWDNWSKKGAKYKKGECLLRWPGFDPAGPVRVGTIYYHSKEAGWSPSPDDVSSSPWDEIVERMNTQFALVVIGGKVRILKENIVVDDWDAPFDIIGKDDFKLLHENKIHAWIRPSDGKSVFRTEAEIWLAHQARREYPNGVGMYPSNQPPGVYNTWQGYTVKPTRGNINIYLSHIKNVICSGDSKTYEWVLDWIADLFQDPANPKGCAIVMRGDEGAGKGTLVKPLAKIFGSHYTHLIDTEHLTGRFSGHLEQTVLLFADEVVWGGDKKASGKLKGLVTEKVITTERKGIDAVSQRNFAHVIMASNNDWVVPAGPNSRRWFVTDVSNKYVMKPQYFTRLKKWMDDENNISAILGYFMDRDITHNLRRAPETKALKEQRELHVQHEPIPRWWMTCVQDGIVNVPDDSNSSEDVDWPVVVDRIIMFNEFEQWCMTRGYKVPSPTVFYNKMMDFGMAQTRPNTNGVRRYKFKLPTREGAALNLRNKGYHIEIGEDT